MLQAIPEKDLSRGFNLDIACDACGKRFAMHHPIFLDAERAPDYRPFMKPRGLALTQCPRCSATTLFNGPLLWIRRSARPHLLFLADDSRSPVNPNNVEILISNLAGMLGGLPEAWTSEKLQTIEYRFLPYLLERCAEPSSDEWVATVQWQVILAAQLPVGHFDMFAALCAHHPELLWAPADKALQRLADVASKRGESGAHTAFTSARTVLSILRAGNGIDIKSFAGGES